MLHASAIWAMTNSFIVLSTDWIGKTGKLEVVGQKEIQQAIESVGGSS